MRTTKASVWAILMLTVLIPATNQASTGAVSAQAIHELERAADADSVSLHPVTGAVRHARFPAGRVAANGESIEERAELFLVRHGEAFGVTAPSAQLELKRDVVDRLGHTHLVYDQVHSGIPVFGARLGLHFDDRGELIRANGNLLPRISVASTVPRLTAREAGVRARTLVAKQERIDRTLLEIAEIELVVFHDGVIWGRSGDTHVAWVVEVGNGDSIREQLFFDAHTGRLLEQITGIEEITRYVYENDSSNLVWQEGDEQPYSGSGEFRDHEINNLINVSEQTYNTFFNISGGSFLSWNGADGAMRHYYDRNGIDCPNAYFNGSATNFCVGTATDDVIAHEWAHGYTQSTHGLVYAWQSGALNESYSDIFGEIVDLLYDTSGSDEPSTVRASGSCSAATGHDLPSLVIESPASLAGSMEVSSATFNPAPPWSVNGTVEAADDGVGLGNDACDPLVDFTPGNIALITLTNCTERFLTPVLNAQAAGAIGVIMANPLNDNLVDMTGAGDVTIPSVFIGRTDGDAIRAVLDEGVVATLGSSGDGSLRWLVAEDSAAFSGAIRDMWNPGCLGDPNRVLSGRYHCADSDNGGVHINSGVPNHAFALLVDGGSSNGVEVPAIGMTRAAHVYWRAMVQYQLPLSDFRDHADILATSCADLLGAPLPDLLTGQVSPEVIAPIHCAAVESAMTATEMRAWPEQCGFETILDPDPPQRFDPLEVYAESFDSDPGTWTLSNEGVYDEYTPRDWVWTESVPDEGDGGAFYAIDSPDIGNCVAGSDDQSGVMHLDSPAITLPLATRPVLYFDHYVATERHFDGGNLKISVNGSEFELVESEAFLFNDYNGWLLPEGFNDNPLAGQDAFVGTNENSSRGSWGQSQVDLSGYAKGGDMVVLRFDFGTDGCHGQDGWYVDNVRLSMTPRERDSGPRVTPNP